jgi:outer membrane protein assembly factor BamB
LKNDRLYVGDYDGKLWCLTTGGEVSWEFETQAEIDSSVNFYKDNVLVGSQDATLYCLNAESGELVWKYEIADQIRCCPTIVEGRAFVAGCDGQLHMIDLDKGEPTEAVDLEGPTGVTPAVMGDHVFVGTEGGLFLGINWREAEETWRFEDSLGQQSYRGAAAASQQYVVVGSRDKRLRAFNPLTGEPLWTFAAKGRIDSSPVIAGNRVYVGSADGRVYGIDLETGEERWQFEAGGGFTASPAVAQGRLIIASDDGVIYCFGK